MRRLLVWTASGALLGSFIVFLGVSSPPVSPGLPEQAVSSRERLIAVGSTAPAERWFEAVDTAYPTNGLLRFQSRLPVTVLNFEGYERAIREIEAEHEAEHHGPKERHGRKGSK